MNDLNLPVAPNFTAEEVAASCRKWGVHLRVPSGIDGPRLLWALSGCESSFGRDCELRHEMAYCTGRYSADTKVKALTGQFAHAAHCSFGPWQIMLVNCSSLTTPEDLFTIDAAAFETVAFINSRILFHEAAQTVAEVADAYNSGDWRDKIVPAKYIADCVNYYGAYRMPD